MENTTATVTVAPDLLEKIQALKALATSHNLIDSGSYHHSKFQAVAMSLDFLRALYEQVKAEVIAHPDCDLTPEGQELKKQSSEGASNV